MKVRFANLFRLKYLIELNTMLRMYSMESQVIQDQVKKLTYVANDNALNFIRRGEYFVAQELLYQCE